MSVNKKTEPITRKHANNISHALEAVINSTSERDLTAVGTSSGIGPTYNGSAVQQTSNIQRVQANTSKLKKSQSDELWTKISVKPTSSARKASLTTSNISNKPLLHKSDILTNGKTLPSQTCHHLHQEHVGAETKTVKLTTGDVNKRRITGKTGSRVHSITKSTFNRWRESSKKSASSGTVKFHSSKSLVKVGIKDKVVMENFDGHEDIQKKKVLFKSRDKLISSNISNKHGNNDVFRGASVPEDWTRRVSRGSGGSDIIAMIDEIESLSIQNSSGKDHHDNDNGTTKHTKSSKDMTLHPKRLTAAGLEKTVIVNVSPGGSRVSSGSRKSSISQKSIISMGSMTSHVSSCSQKSLAEKICETRAYLNMDKTETNALDNIDRTEMSNGSTPVSHSLNSPSNCKQAHTLNGKSIYREDDLRSLTNVHRTNNNFVGDQKQNFSAGHKHLPDMVPKEGENSFPIVKRRHLRRILEA